MSASAKCICMYINIAAIHIKSLNKIKNSFEPKMRTFDLEFGVPGVAVPPGIFDSLSPLPFVMGVLNVVTDDCMSSTRQIVAMVEG